MRTLASLVCLALSSSAVAQVNLPAVRMPQLPAIGVPSLPAALPATVSGDAGVGELDPRRLQELRALRIRELLRRHRDVLEADPDGAPIVRGEVLALAPSAQAVQAAVAAGFSVRRELTLTALDLRVAVWHVSGPTARGLQRLQALDPDGTYDFNHVYLEAGPLPAGAADTAAATGPGAPDSGAATAPVAVALTGASSGSNVSVGLIDSGIDATHEVFRGLTLQRRGCPDRAVPAPHGTAVASLLVGRASALHGAAPGAALYAADVFCGKPTGGSVDEIAEAFAWLVEQHIPVINVSLVGPPDRLLEQVVERVLARGSLVVAAVGNDGPAAPALYPAAWPGVVGVTGVDAHGHVLAEAERGPQVKFAAPGADMAAARVSGSYLRVRGTSFAAPIVAGLLAIELKAPDPTAARDAVAALARVARHPGSETPDPAYGYGVIGEELRHQPALAGLIK
jgi:subtilisin family serine protease